MYSPVISDELKFLISLCSRNRTEASDYISKQGNLGYLDDKLVFQLAQRHRIEPLVWSLVCQSDIFSDDVRHLFEIAFRQNQKKALNAKVVQNNLQSMLDQHSLKGIFFKGIGIAERFYGDIAERHVLDIDLCVSEHSLIDMTRELKSLGYFPQPDITEFNSSQFDFFKSTHHDIYFLPVNDDRLIPVELHWQIKGQFTDFITNFNDGLDPPDLFLYLCVHGTEHGWFRLKWLMDLPRVIKLENFNWDLIWARALRLNCRHHLAITMALLDNLRIYPLPIEFNGLISVSKYEYQLTYILRALTSESHFNDNDSNRWYYFKYQWSLRSKKFNFSFFRKFMTSPEDWKIIRFSKNWFFLYYLFRPCLWVYRRIVKS